VLAGSAAPATAPLMSGEEAPRTLEGLLTAVPTVVVDLGSHLDERVVASLEAADDVVITVTPDFPTLKVTHSFFEFLNEVGSRISEPTIVVNEIYALPTLTPGDIENALGRRVAIRIPPDATTSSLRSSWARTRHPPSRRPAGAASRGSSAGTDR